MTKVANAVKLFRIGMVVLVIGISFLITTHLRARVLDTGTIGNYLGFFGPFLFEPRETTLVLREAEPPQNLTVAIVSQNSWNPERTIREADTALLLVGLSQADAVVFKIGTRGLYWVLVMTETGELTGDTELSVEQKGLSEDLLWFSYTLIIVGITILIFQRLRGLKHS